MPKPLLNVTTVSTLPDVKVAVGLRPYSKEALDRLRKENREEYFIKRGIVALVWDDAATTEQHPELRQGLLRIAGVRDAIILPRPKKMTRAATGSQQA